MRFPEIDWARGVGIGLVVIYHFLFDLNYWGINDIVNTLPVLLMGRFAAALLIFVSGLSLWISIQKWKGNRGEWEHYAKRFALLAGVAALITVATWIYPHDGFIFFGIIHFLALAMLVGLLLSYSKMGLKLVTVVSVPIWLVMQTQMTASPWLSILGANTTIYTVDLFSIFPWIGVFTLGMLAADALYAANKRKFRMPFALGPGWLGWMGQNSLIIYLAEQPVLFAIFFLLLGRGFG